MLPNSDRKTSQEIKKKWCDIKADTNKVLLHASKVKVALEEFREQWNLTFLMSVWCL